MQINLNDTNQLKQSVQIRLKENVLTPFTTPFMIRASGCHRLIVNRVFYSDISKYSLLHAWVWSSILWLGAANDIPFIWSLYRTSKLPTNRDVPKIWGIGASSSGFTLQYWGICCIFGFIQFYLVEQWVQDLAGFRWQQQSLNRLLLPLSNLVSYRTLLFDLWGYWHCGHSWLIVPASGDSEDDCGEADGM
jgi:hypothetical protein